jgi:hypothetical protein
MAMMEAFFPMEIRAFFERYYDTEMVLLKQNDTGWDADKLWRVEDFRAVYDAFVATGTNAREISVHPPRDAQGKSQGKGKLQDGDTFEEVERKLKKDGASFVFRYENVPEHARPMYALEKALAETSGIPVSIHMYVSAPGAQVLEPHTDPYDVMVFQIQGTKNWTACVPVPEVRYLRYARSGARPRASVLDVVVVIVRHCRRRRRRRRRRRHHRCRRDRVFIRARPCVRLGCPSL